PLAAQRSCVQFLDRGDDDLALADIKRRLAAQSDTVVTNDVDTHEWVSCLCRGGCRPSAHRRSLRAPKPVFFGNGLVLFDETKHRPTDAKPRLPGSQIFIRPM